MKNFSKIFYNLYSDFTLLQRQSSQNPPPAWASQSNTPVSDHNSFLPESPPVLWFRFPLPQYACPAFCKRNGRKPHRLLQRDYCIYPTRPRTLCQTIFTAITVYATFLFDTLYEKYTRLEG